jgi:hypothetical protein
LGIAGAVVEALGESRLERIRRLLSSPSIFPPLLPQDEDDEKSVANYPSRTSLDALDLGYDDNLTLPILTGAIVWVWLTVVSAMTS